MVAGVPRWLPQPEAFVRRSLCIAAICLLTWAASGAAQTTGAVAGRVVDAATRQPVVGARVRLPRIGRETVTDARGIFRLTSIPPGDHTVTLSRLGYRTRVGAWRVGAEGLEVEVQLETEPLALQGIRAEGRVF